MEDSLFLAALCGALTGAVAGCLVTFAVRALQTRRRARPDWRNPSATWTERPLFRGQR